MPAHIGGHLNYTIELSEDTFEKIKLSHNFKSGSNSSGKVFFTEKDGGINFEAHILG